MKLTFGRYQKSDIVERYLSLYKELGGGTLIKKGNAFRMPKEYFVELLEYPKQLAKHYSMKYFIASKAYLIQNSENGSNADGGYKGL